MRLNEITDRIMSASATLIAVVALATGVYQAKMSRDQAKASVWPYLISGSSANGGYARIVQNVGLGPAIIGGFAVRVDGKTMHSWPEVARALGVQISFRQARSTTFRPGLVVPTNTTVDLIQLPDSADMAAMFSRAEHLETWICYCSLYHDCWELDGSAVAPRQTRGCVDDPATAFRS